MFRKQQQDAARQHKQVWWVVLITGSVLLACFSSSAPDLAGIVGYSLGALVACAAIGAVPYAIARLAKAKAPQTAFFTSASAVLSLAALGTLAGKQEPQPEPRSTSQSTGIEWRQFSPAGAPELSVSLPAAPREFTYDVVNEGYKFTEHHAQVLFPEDRLAYGLAYFDLPVPADAIGDDEARSLLELFKTGLLVKNDAVQRTENSAPRNGLPCMDFLATAKVSGSSKALLHFRLYLSGNRVYQLFSSAPPTETPNGNEERFFSSFAIN